VFGSSDKRNGKVWKSPYRLSSKTVKALVRSADTNSWHYCHDSYCTL